MATEKKQTKKENEARIVAAGRKCLRAWLQAAAKHGVIYYAIPAFSSSGAYRTLRFWTIKRVNGKPALVELFPRLPDDMPGVRMMYADELDIVAKDWGFSFKKRAFESHGGGMDMVFATVYRFAQRAGIDKPLEFANAINREGLGS